MDWFTGSKQGEVKRLVSHLGNPVRRENAAQELIRRGAESIPILLEALQTGDPNLLLIYQQVLARIPSASSHLIKIIGSAHPLLRSRALEVIAMSGDRSAIPALLEAVKGEFFTVRSRAATALGSIGDPVVIPALLPLLKDQEDEVRIAACIALGEFADPTTFDEIADVLLEDPKIEVRQAAARTLGYTNHPAAIPFLMEALRDPFWWYEREQAAHDLLSAIEKMGDAVVEPLIEALADKEGTVRKYAAAILGNLGDPRALEELGMAIYDLHHEVSRAAAEALGKYGAPALGILEKALRHDEPGIREFAVLAMGSIQDETVAPALIDMLRDPNRAVRRQVILSLGALRDHRALPALQQIVAIRTDREMASLAKEVIARIDV